MFAARVFSDSADNETFAKKNTPLIVKTDITITQERLDICCRKMFFGRLICTLVSLHMSCPFTCLICCLRLVFSYAYPFYIYYINWNKKNVAVCGEDKIIFGVKRE